MEICTLILLPDNGNYNTDDLAVLSSKRAYHTQAPRAICVICERAGQGRAGQGCPLYTLITEYCNAKCIQIQYVHILNTALQFRMQNVKNATEYPKTQKLLNIKRHLIKINHKI